jgi:hypothetical protein
VIAGLYVKFSPRLARDLVIAAELLACRTAGRLAQINLPRNLIVRTGDDK